MARTGEKKRGGGGGKKGRGGVGMTQCPNCKKKVRKDPASANATHRLLTYYTIKVTVLCPSARMAKLMIRHPAYQVEHMGGW